MRATVPLGFLALLLAGCGTRPAIQTEAHRTTLADNTRDYDRYVERRTELLYRSGAFKDRQEAEFKARSEATHRYGERPSEYSSSWTWSTQRNGQRVSPTALNSTLDQMKKTPGR